MLQASKSAGAAGGRIGGGQRAGGQQGGGDEGGRGRGHVRPCPICGKPAQQATRPFCSKRCRDVDLNRWLSGAYLVPGAENEDEGSE